MPCGGLDHTLRHGVSNVGDGLTAVLVILIGLDGDGCQSRIALDALRLTKIAVTGGEAAVEQLQNVDLTAGSGQGVEIEIVDMDVALPVCLGMLGAEQIHLIIGLCTGSADLQHGAHGGVAVDIGIVPLHIGNAGIDVGDLIDGLHQRRAGFPGPCTVGAVQDVCLGCAVEAMIHQLLLHRILNHLNMGRLRGKMILQLPLDIVSHPGSVGGIALSGNLHGLQDRCGDLVLIVQNHAAVALDNTVNHCKNTILS